MKSTSAVYNPGMLPSEGLDDLTLQLREYFSVLKYELMVIDGMRTGPLDYPIMLDQELDAARYHLATMVAMIELQLRRSGTDFGARANDAPGIQSALMRYRSSLLRAKALWNAWLDGGTLSFGGFGEDGTSVPSTAEDPVEQAALDVGKGATTPSASKILMTLGVGLGMAGLIYALRR